jgi:hypothetical protein
VRSLGVGGAHVVGRAAAGRRAELPCEQTVGEAVAAEAAGVQAAKVVRDADGDEVVVFFTTALGAEHDVMCLQIAP